ncbi:bifunctional glutamate--cysteine ligase GshA/glutathione synthetase GshB [Chengkuizengella axinellae]|uniref:Glutathione biosynthesis bifunctional protein GshAB n=1 Tax=Chengkuizengella axinellae TaxID=3064388 RepID=A0ABT9J1P8_9BACL|nr:bifunctional glutamate--cysteine ligase GshA/glutathione synthetase GshB [Chengkuizengella sp. 2205SS18-9]MDP5275517.1 bifunctional glutamate--cysteine ligase GshA/glutathione synthetase GshB [Chengkuizengella sp. 2205SS18-9]
MVSHFFDIVQKLNLEQFLFKGNFGIEKENVRVKESGELALSPHPKSFGNKLANPYITTDFSESQIEMVTPMFNTIEECYRFLENLHHIVALELEREYLWPQSNPPMLPNESEIPIAKYENTEKGKEAEKYRENLAADYGKKRQLISGIHYNFSFNEEFLQKVYSASNLEISFKQFKNETYLKISRFVLEYRWLLIYLFGASPGVHSSYNKECVDEMEKIDEESSHFEFASSFRNGVCGYRNEDNPNVSYDSVDQYVEDIKQLVRDGKIQSEKEYYSPIRLKAKDKSDLLTSLQNDGIQYIELRILDLNPFSKIGIHLDTLYFIHLFILFSLFHEESNSSNHTRMTSFMNHELVASLGRKQHLKLFKNVREVISLKEWGNEILDQMAQIISKCGIKQDLYDTIIQHARNQLNEPNQIISSKIIDEIKEESFIKFHINKAKQYLEEIKSTEYHFLGYEDMELSTQILLKDAIKKGIDFKVLDREENFIVLNKGSKKEYIKQATKTSLDSYSTIQIMENKVVTKKVLDEYGILVPKGIVYGQKDGVVPDYISFVGQEIVIKPKSTNFGLGITILKGHFSKTTFERAIELAFKYDHSILIEEFVHGREYRFFVIKEEVVGILHRVPANVTGDGKSTIEKLVKEKNKDPLRGKGYKTPLEKINLGESEEMFLGTQGLNFQSIPQIGETLYLRENSNISTGGDSIDFTVKIPNYYKNIAVSAAKAVGATICGVDMIISDVKKETRENYSIIELNFNPAIHIHCFPFKGENRKLGEKLLEALGF